MKLGQDAMVQFVSDFSWQPPLVLLPAQGSSVFWIKLNFPLN
jgi:hypothetical protein